ncbi:uncharacterized protein M421DRAFT_421063, partial [Didymella exigua CBS 183.55]
MTQEADFFGDRLRLSAFLRIVADGIPQRPTRFKRRLFGICHGEPSCQQGPGLLDAKSAPDQETADNTTVPDVVRSSSPQPPELAAEGHRLADHANSRSQEDRGRAEPEDQRRIGERTSITAINKPPNQPRQVSRIRRRRHLPVNELALLRTTSSNGLPLPRDADHIFVVPVAALDPIEDSQIRSATLFKNSAGRSQGHRVRKLSPVRGVKSGSPALLLRERFAHVSSAKSKGSHSSTSPRSELATGSDGFVGVELHIQHPTKWNKPRASNRPRTKKSVCNNGGLVLTSGYLPAPPIEHQHSGLIMTESQLHTAALQAAGTTNEAIVSLPLLQHAVAEVFKVTREKEARERRQSQVQRYDDLVRSQLSIVTAPSRRTPESSSSGSAGDADEKVTYSRTPSLEFDESHEQITPQWLCTAATGRAHDQIEAERYFERAMCDLDAAGRSDSVSGELCPQYSGLERSDGLWDARGATGSVRYI